MSMRLADSIQTAGSEAPARIHNDPAATAYRDTRIGHWDLVAQWMKRRKGFGTTYHRRLQEVFGFLCPPGKRVLEIGCASGDLVASLRPSYGVGIDFSSEMVRQAQKRHPDLTFLKADAHELELEEQFDVIILSDLVNDLWDVQQVLSQVRKLCGPQTRLIMNFYSKLWGLPISIARWVRLARPNLPQNWLTVEDVTGLLSLTDFEVIRHREEVLLPLPVPFVKSLANRFLVKLWPFRIGALTHVLVARPGVVAAEERDKIKPLVSVVIAARNEAGNIENIFARTPELGSGTELIFVEGGSSDDTYEVIESAIAAHPERNSKLFKQTGKGKGDAVRLGFAKASGDILMILDADLTVPPEDLPRFVEVLTSGKGDFANGCRLVYPMEKEAMRFFNLAGNKFFGLAFSWLLGQPIRDTLCGTKVIRRSDYEVLAANRSYFGDFDPFGDFDLLFGAAKLNLKIVDVPIRYRDRTYGATNIQRWSHGWLLLRMVMFAARRIKFV
jgi:SAM-dependent methyltransferase